MLFLGKEEQPDQIVTVPDGVVVFNPVAALLLRGSQYDGSFPTNSGMLIYGPDACDEPTFSLEFTTPGTYGYICYFHPNKTGTVTVLAEGTIVPFDQLTCERDRGPRERDLYRRAGGSEGEPRALSEGG